MREEPSSGGDHEAPSDEILVTRVAAGDRLAFRDLMQRALPQAMRTARNVLPGGGEADDVVQEAFLRVWRQAARYDAARGRFTTWLHRIVVNLAIDRRRRRRPHVELEAAAELPDAAPSAPDRLEQAATRRRVRDALDQLPERQRLAVELFYLQGMTSREAAAVLDVSDEALQQLLARGRRALRARLAASDEV